MSAQQLKLPQPLVLLSAQLLCSQRFISCGLYCNRIFCLAQHLIWPSRPFNWEWVQLWLNNFYWSSRVLMGTRFFFILNLVVFTFGYTTLVTLWCVQLDCYLCNICYLLTISSFLGFSDKCDCCCVFSYSSCKSHLHTKSCLCYNK